MVVAAVGALSLGCRRGGDGKGTAPGSRAGATDGSHDAHDVAARYRKAIEHAVEGAKIGPGTEDRSFVVELPDGAKFTARYGQVERDCAARPRSCDDAIRESLTGLFIPRFDTKHLSATIKDTRYINSRITLADGRRPAPLLARPFVADLWMVLTEENPEQQLRSLLDKGSLGSYRLPESTLYETAVANIDREFPELAPQPYRRGSPVLMVESEVAAALVLRPQRWQPVTKRVKGDLLASVPNAQTVLLAGSANKAHVEALRKLTNELENTDYHPISRTLLRWTPDGWVPFQP
jgi:hypothetical protein